MANWTAKYAFILEHQMYVKEVGNTRREISPDEHFLIQVPHLFQRNQFSLKIV